MQEVKLKDNIRYVEGEFHCQCGGTGGTDEDGTDRGFYCPDCRTELITPYKGCDLAGHCITCKKTWLIDDLPPQDDDEE